MIYFAGAKVNTDDVLCRCQGERSRSQRGDAAARGHGGLRRQRAVGKTHLRSHVSSLTSQISRLKSHVSDLTSQLSRLRSQVSDLTSQLSSLKFHVSNLTSQVSRLRSHISDLTSQVSRLRSHVSDLKSPRHQALAWPFVLLLIETRLYCLHTPSSFVSSEEQFEKNGLFVEWS